MADPLIPRDGRLRWPSVFLRALHLAAVIWLAAALLGAPQPLTLAAAAASASGVALFAVDLMRKPALVHEVSGSVVLVKLALLGWLAYAESARLALFWLIVLLSAVSAHAPARFRHARWRAEK